MGGPTLPYCGDLLPLVVSAWCARMKDKRGSSEKGVRFTVQTRYPVYHQVLKGQCSKTTKFITYSKMTEFI